MRRYALRDDQWERIEGLLPGREGHVGVTAKDNRLFVEAVLYRYRAGTPWRDLPARFGDLEEGPHPLLPLGEDRRVGETPGSTHDVSLDQPGHVGVVPRGLLALAPQAGLSGVVGAGEVERDPAQAGEVARRPALADAAVVLGEADVQDPMQAVLHPMLPDGPAEPRRIGLGAGQEVADLACGREPAPAVAADGLDRDHRPHVGPVPQPRQGVQIAADEHAPAHQAAVAGVGAVVGRQVVRARRGRSNAGRTRRSPRRGASSGYP